MVNYRLSEGTPALKQINIPMDDVKIEQPFSLADIIGGDSEGTTETDSKTAPKSGGYSTVNSKRT